MTPANKSYKELIREAIMKRKVLLISVLAGSVALLLGIHSWLSREEAPLTASGTLEARNINVGSKVGGRVSKVLANEGDRVEANQLLVSFEDAELSARLLQARGQLEQAQANLAKMQHGSRPEEIAEAQATSGSSSGSLAQSRADLERAKADYTNADINYRRAQQLADEGVFSRQYRDDAAARLDMAKAQVASLEHAVAAAEGRMHAADAAAKLAERGFRKEDIAAARA